MGASIHGDFKIIEDHIEDFVLAGDISLLEIIPIELAYRLPFEGGESAPHILEDIIGGRTEMALDHLDQDFTLGPGQILERVSKLILDVFLDRFGVFLGFSGLHICGFLLILPIELDALYGIGEDIHGISAVAHILSVLLVVGKNGGSLDDHFRERGNNRGITAADMDPHDPTILVDNRGIIDGLGLAKYLATEREEAYEEDILGCAVHSGIITTKILL